MKQYRRDIKKHMSDEEYEAYKKTKKRDSSICRGGKPHDYVLVLPYHVKYNPDVYKFNPERYYEILDETNAFIEKQKQKLTEMGVRDRYSSLHRRETRHFMCSVCHKLKYDF